MLTLPIYLQDVAQPSTLVFPGALHLDYEMTLGFSDRINLHDEQAPTPRNILHNVIQARHATAATSPRKGLTTNDAPQDVADWVYPGILVMSDPYTTQGLQVINQEASQHFTEMHLLPAILSIAAEYGEIIEEAVQRKAQSGFGGVSLDDVVTLVAGLFLYGFGP